MRETDQEWEVCKARLRQALEEDGISQVGLARKLKVHRNTVGQWLKPGIPACPNLHQFLQLAGILNRSGRWFLGLRNDPTPPSYLTGPEREWLDLLRGLKPVERQALLEAAKEGKGLGQRA